MSSVVVTTVRGLHIGSWALGYCFLFGGHSRQAPIQDDDHEQLFLYCLDFLGKWIYRGCIRIMEKKMEATIVCRIACETREAKSGISSRRRASTCSRWQYNVDHSLGL